MTCAWFAMLGCIPFTGLRLSLCSRHIDRCSRCRQASDDDDALPPLVTADRLAPGLDLWPGVKQGTEGSRKQAIDSGFRSLPARRSWRLAYVATMIALLLLVGFWIIVSGRRGSMLSSRPSAYRPAPQTRLCSAKIEDRPARVFQVQSRNPDRTIFWIAKDNNRS